jgi:hypothetical protein
VWGRARLHDTRNNMKFIRSDIFHIDSHALVHPYVTLPPTWAATHWSDLRAAGRSAGVAPPYVNDAKYIVSAASSLH